MLTVPNMWAALMKFVVDLLVMLYVVCGKTNTHCNRIHFARIILLRSARMFESSRLFDSGPIGHFTPGFGPEYGCLQLWTILSVWLLCFPMITASTIVEMLDDPFVSPTRTATKEMHDVYNVDNLMGSTEHVIFACLRTTFDRGVRAGDAQAIGDKKTGQPSDKK